MTYGTDSKKLTTDIGRYFTEDREFTPEEEGLGKVLYYAHGVTPTYGKEFKPKALVNAWMFFLHGKYDIDTIVLAILNHVSTKGTMPTPSCVKAYVEGDQVSEAEFIAASKERDRLKKTGEWNQFQPEMRTIMKYNDQKSGGVSKQTSEDTAKELMDYVRDNSDMEMVASSNVKSIND